MIENQCKEIMGIKHNCTHAIHILLRQYLDAVPRADLQRSLDAHSIHGRSEVQAPSATNSTLDVDYDYKGALLFVVGLLCMYGLCILLLIISLIRKSRTELELVDHLRDFEAMRRASQKKGVRLYHQNTIEELDEEAAETTPRAAPTTGYKSIRPDPGDDDEYCDIMSVSRAKRKARRDSFTDSRMSSQDTVSSFDDSFCDSSNSPVHKEPRVLCMYCARRLTTPGECVHCEHEKAIRKLKPAAASLAETCTSIPKPNGIFQRGPYSPEREKYWVEKDPKLQETRNTKKPKFTVLGRYHSLDSTHHELLENELENSETDFIPSTSERRRSFGNMRLTKQFSLDCSSDDDSGLNSDTKPSEESIESGTKQINVLDTNHSANLYKTKRASAPIGLQRNSRWVALKSGCPSNFQENIPEEDEEDDLTG